VYIPWRRAGFSRRIAFSAARCSEPSQWSTSPVDASRAALLVGATVGTLAWSASGFVFAGNPITQHALSGADALSLLLILYVFRFGLGAVPYGWDLG